MIEHIIGACKTLVGEEVLARTPRLLRGTVTATSPLTVSFGTLGTVQPRAGTVTGLAENDRVLILHTKTATVIIGRYYTY